ncbi:MAG: hypothetical protein JSR96_08355 [Proteobacteria bacterium]|nr:hypothetical protein [Pseudomonadota bacterium]
MPTPLPAIAALVRAGAVERAWDLFVAGGYAARTDDAASRAVLGRLLKARARLADEADRKGLFAAAADAYAAAHAISPAPYLAINASTLRLLAADEISARSGAQAVLALLDSSTAADTPYYLAATRAEALLLLGDRSGAEAAMELAARHDPDGWTDRATTLSQLREIMHARGEQADWLERFTPPVSLHFAGHMGFSADGERAEHLARAVDDLIASKRIGFAWGALAAGADIIIAERLLQAGAELHVVLPCVPEVFEKQSVIPAGSAWQTRYHRVLAQAKSLRYASADPKSVHDPIATAHAGELAIGATLLNAAALSSSCCQLVVTDADGGGRNTAQQARAWPVDRGTQHRLTVQRDTRIEALFPPDERDPARALSIHIAIQIDQLASPANLDPATVAALTRPMSEVLGRFDRRRIRAAPGRWDITLDDLGTALEAMIAIQRRYRSEGLPGPSIGAHIAIAHLFADPASEEIIPYGPGADLAQRLRAMAPSGLTLISDALAVTMAARQTTVARSELYHPGDEDSDGSVHVLLPALQ